jgi:cell division protein FtsL
MSRMTLLFFVLATISGMMTFSTKQKVAVLEKRLRHTTQKIRTHEESMHVLSAEWNFLNNPVRLQKLAERHLGLVPGESCQVVRLHKKSPGSSSKTYDTEAMMRLASQLGE